MTMTAETEKPKTFDPVIHAQLRRDADAIASAANIPPRLLWKSMIGSCTPEEIDYVKHVRKQTDGGISGLVYTGVTKYSIIERMQLIAGTLLRNFINAKVMTLQDVLGAINARQMPRPSVLLIPNFFDTSNSVVMEWQGGLLLDALMSRHIHGQQTILYVSSLEDLGKAHGITFERFIRDNFKIISPK